MESPPPIMDVASDLATASAIFVVPWENASTSKTPIGPFQKIVFAFDMILEYFSMVLGPISRAISASGRGKESAV